MSVVSVSILWCVGFVKIWQHLRFLFCLLFVVVVVVVVSLLQFNYQFDLPASSTQPLSLLYKACGAVHQGMWWDLCAISLFSRDIMLLCVHLTLHTWWGLFLCFTRAPLMNCVEYLHWFLMVFAFILFRFFLDRKVLWKSWRLMVIRKMM